MDLRGEAAGYADELMRLRRELHADPELGLELPRTQQRVLEALDGLPLEVSTGTALSSVTAVLRGGRPGPTVLLRGDMDALPVTEDVDVPYRSPHAERMHACGHDLHTAGLVGAARLLCAHRDELPGNVIFMFQPGEEGDGGAELMIEEGVLDAAGDRPVAAYGLHVLSSKLPLGVVTGRPGPTMSAIDTFTVRVIGQGGHGSLPHTTRDPIPAICEMVTALQAFVTRSFDVFDPVILTIGELHAGTANNVIPGEARFGAAIRSFSEQARDRLTEGAPRVVRGIAAAHDLDVELDYIHLYPATVNDPAEYAHAEATIIDLLGGHRFVPTPNPIPGSEDFSYVLREVPGAFVFLGACPPDSDPDTAPSNHAARAAFDDAVLPDAAALLAELAARRLSGRRS